MAHSRTAIVLRRNGKRLLGRFGAKHSGYFFVWTQAALARLERRAARRVVPARVDAVTIPELPSRVPGATYTELEPPEPEPVPPEDWRWPRRFPPRFGRYRALTRGCGVLEIPGGVVFGEQGLIGPDPTGALVDAAALLIGEEEKIRAVSARAAARGVVDLGGVTISAWAGNVGRNYAHCLLQSVPRLELMRRAFGLDADRYLVAEHTPVATFDALTRLGIGDDRIQRVPPRDAPAYRCDVLRAASSPLFQEIGADWVVRFLHELFLPEPPPRRGRRLYIRRGVPRRAVLNEADVDALLEQLGFEALTMQELTTQQQAELFADAEAIVSTHGAALANIVFAPPGTAVVELMGTNTASTAYAYLSWRRGLRYDMVMGLEPAPLGRWWTWQVNADTVVDVSGLKTALDRLGVR